MDCENSLLSGFFYFADVKIHELVLDTCQNMLYDRHIKKRRGKHMLRINVMENDAN